MLRLYNTLNRQVAEVEPLEPGVIKMYTCGPTVYRDAHIGNLRAYLMADWIRRAFEYQGISVTTVKNITDVGHMRQEELERGEDKVVAAALAEGKSPQEIAEFYTARFLDDEAKLNIKRPDTLPKATDHIKEMIDITERLVENGLAYEANGNVYFSVASFAKYGALSGNTEESQLQAAVRIEADPLKRDPRDFTLWKAAEPGRDLKWPSPWGEGFPGWHIECSAMSIKYLGDRFDIHTGGVDNIFPHHEDEIAQSEGYTGRPVVNTWVHGQHLLADGVKMAKSLGNSFTVADIEALQIDPLALRYLCLTARHSTRLNFTFSSLKAAQRALLRLRNMMWQWGLASTRTDGASDPEGSAIGMPAALNAEPTDPAAEEEGPSAEPDASHEEPEPAEGELPAEPEIAQEQALAEPQPPPEPPVDLLELRSEWLARFLDRVNDNLDLPGALSLTWRLAKSDASDRVKLEIVREFDKVLGLGLDTGNQTHEVTAEVTGLVHERAAFRQTGEYAKADQLREQMVSHGWVVEDTQNGTRIRPQTAWEKREETRATVSSSLDVESLIEQDDAVDFTVGIVASNYNDDVSQCLQSALWWGRDRSLEAVVVDNGSTDGTGDWLAQTAAVDARVSVVHTDHVVGAGAAYNIVLKRSRGRTVILLDPSVEVRGDLLGPIDALLDEDRVGVAGPYGLRSEDLQHFHEGEGEAGEMDAMQAYCFAFRRRRLRDVGLMRESFRFYRNLDIDYSFHFKDAGLRILADPTLPVRRHEHRAWTELAETDRDELSRKNFGRFLHKWGNRVDLLASLQMAFEAPE